MNLTLITVVLASFFIAYVNGANDVSKGIATLAGSSVTTDRRAIVWGALWTTIGSVASFGLAAAMVTTFGKGLLASGVVPSLAAAIATFFGAGIWVGLATRFGLPVSTTHAIVGSIAGVTTVAYGIAGMNWVVFGAKIALPLLLSPLASLVITSAALLGWKRLKPSANADCLRAEIVPATAAVAAAPVNLAIDVKTVPAIRVIGCRQPVAEINRPHTVSITINQLHWLTSAAASFARGLNDAPKMAALLLTAAALSGRAIGSSLSTYLLIAVGILAGSLSSGQRVTTVLAERITLMDHREGFIANLITASLVGPGAALGLPMSTTHVATGAIIGVGLQRDRSVNWSTIRDMVLAWLVTLPGAALLGILSYALFWEVRIR